MKKLSILCALSVFCLLFSGFSSAEATSTPEDLTFGGLISEEVVLAAGHQQISSKYESVLNALEYENADGTRTVYAFAEPIKFVNDDGAVQRIDSSLKYSSKNSSWGNTANWFDVSISDNYTEGVSISFGNNSLTAKPVLSGGVSSLSRTTANSAVKKSLSFGNDSATANYTVSNTGYYATISIVGGTSFSFDVSGNIASVDTEAYCTTFTMQDGNAVAYSLADLNINSQYADFSNVQVTVLSAESGTYRMTYTVNAATTQRLESVQLTVEAEAFTAESATGGATRDSSDNVPASYCIDTTVYSNYPTNNYGSAIRCLVGVDGTMGKSQSYYRFDLSQFSDIPYDRVLSANLRLRELTGYDSSFQAVAYIVQTDWTETGIYWNNRPNCFDEKLGTVNVEWADPATGGSRAYYDFYITSAVMAWLQGIPNNGIMLKSRVTTNVNCRAFGSSEYSAYLPQLTITYSTETQSMDNVGIVNGAQYYIKNKHSNLYLTANGTAVGSAVLQKTWSGLAAQKWTVESTGTGYYYLRPNNASGKVLDNSESTNENNLPMVITSRTTSTSQQFKFARNWDGSYRILSKISGGARSLCAKGNNTTNGGVICHRSHTLNWTKTDDWTLEPVVKGSASVYSFTYDDVYKLNTAQFAPQMVRALSNMGYTTYNRVDRSYLNAYNDLSTNSVWVYTGHGGKSCLQFKDGWITATEEFDDNEARIIDARHKAFSQLNLAVFASCETGMDDVTNNTNMVGLTYQKGAHFVIAHTDWTLSPDSDVWLQEFLRNCSQGQTIYEAMDNADTYIYEHPDMYDETAGYISYGNATQRHVLGDNSLCLYHNAS